MALNYEEIGKNLQRIFEKNDLTIDLNILYTKKEKIYPAYVLKHNSKCEKKVFLLMIPNQDGIYYISINKVSALIGGITSKNNGDFYCLNCLHSFRTKSKLETQKKVCGNKHFRKIVEFGKCHKSDKIPMM